VFVSVYISILKIGFFVYLKKESF